MAEFKKWTSFERQEWSLWVGERPTAVREVARQFPPNRLYRLKLTGHRVVVRSFSEPIASEKPVTITVDVLGEFNGVVFERSVFGILPEDLEECDLPAEGEVRGSAGMTEEEVRDYFMNRRQMAI